jgi:hypothetical protein
MDLGLEGKVIAVTGGALALVRELPVHVWLKAPRS